MIKALRDISRHVQQPVGKEGIKEILKTVRECGFDFQPMVDQSDMEKREVELSGAGKPIEHHFGRVEGKSSPRKRKQGSDTTSEAEINDGMAQRNGTSDSMFLAVADDYSRSNSSKYQRISEPFDDYWDLDAYWDAVASPFFPAAPTMNTAISFQNEQTRISPTMAAAKILHNQQIYIPPSQDPSNLLESVPSDIFHPTYNTQQNEQVMNDLSMDSLGPLMGDESALPSFNTFNPLDWNFTLWWDPSSLFDASLNSTQTIRTQLDRGQGHIPS